MKSTTTTTATLQNVAMYNEAGAFIGFGTHFCAGNLETIVPSDALPHEVSLNDVAQLAESYGTDVVIYATPAANPASWRGVGPEPRSLETILDNLQFCPKLTAEQVDELAQELASLVLAGDYKQGDASARDLVVSRLNLRLFGAEKALELAIDAAAEMLPQGDACDFLLAGVFPEPPKGFEEFKGEAFGSTLGAPFGYFWAMNGGTLRDRTKRFALIPEDGAATTKELLDATQGGLNG